MTSSEFTMKIQTALESLPAGVTNMKRSEDERKLAALIHLNSNIYPALKDSETLLEILRMKHGYEKLRIGMLWTMAVSQTSPTEMRNIVELMDYYLSRAV